jgi:hypothetical protein
MLYRQQDYCKHINHLPRWKFLHHLRISSLYGFASVSHLWIIRSKTTSFMDVPVRAGQILWVPRLENVRGDLGIEAAAHDHPCVVLSHVPQRSGKHDILIVSQVRLKPAGFLRGCV